jgi:hypothetical protein
MTKIHIRAFTITVFLLAALGIGTLLCLPKDFFSSTENPVNQTRVVIPQSVDSGGNPAVLVENQNLEESSAARISFGENELVISIITRDFDGDSLEEQIIAYRSLQEIDTPIYIAYADVNAGGIYFRAWTAPAAATRASSLILYSEDLIGDGGICVLVSGLNGSGEQTLTVFRKNSFLFPEAAAAEEAFSKIAEFIIEGSIAVQEVQRSRDYQQEGQPLTISTYGRNYESANMLDQIETTYTYNPLSGLYEQARMVKVPGSQIEQRRVNELLNTPGKFEEFIGGLWHLSTDNGGKQYVYFNPANREMIFYINNTEEVFNWQESNPIRYGLHINGRNSSISKLRCTVNIELESLDSIRLHVFQDAYLRTGPGAVWDGSYQKIQTLKNTAGEKRAPPYLEGTYKAGEGKITFSRDGSYELYGNGEKTLLEGKYVFFNMGEEELLELRPSTPEIPRQTLKVRHTENDGIALTRIRIGTKGIQELETPVSFTRVTRN